MIIMKKSLPRRTFLKGVGATLGLPLLDGMVPAFASEPAGSPARRLAFVYIPNGAIMEKFTPATEGAGYAMTPILEPLAPFRDQLLVLSGLSSVQALGLAGETGGEHPRACATYLTGVHVVTQNIRTGNNEVRAGISVDQIAARELEKHTEIGSLEIGIEDSELTCDGSCAYSNTISWRDATTPLPMQNQPRAIFERMFGPSDSTSPQERTARIRRNRSILDFVNGEVNRLMGNLGAGDRAKVDQYLDAVRDVERRIQKAEQQTGRNLPTMSRPAGIPETFRDHIKLMFDLMTLAFQTDLTRVGSLQAGHEMSNAAYPEIGISDPHHPFTHHQGDPVKIAKSIEINIYHMTMFAYFLEKLRSTPDGSGSLLDHSMIVYGSGLGDGNLHIPKSLPILLAGGGWGRIQGGRHIRYEKDTPLSNLYLALLDRLGLNVEKFGDSTGKLPSLSLA
ncbi:MAG: DUF1552 domain-containing protein [Acidobacteria bacterium]|nr:DUF1552 domain-containing protein [Acidobacteriota bacterium]